MEDQEFLCPNCKLPLVIRTGMKNNFFGCTGFPKCKAKFPVDGGGGPDLSKATEKTKNYTRKTSRKGQVER